MSESSNSLLYDEICNETNTWIIKYCSSTYEKSIFLIWYTDIDESSTDKLLTFKTGEMIAVSTLADINQQITKCLDLLTPSEKLPDWLKKTKYLAPFESVTYNTILLLSALKSNNLEPQILRELITFRNLFSDYMHQDENNSHLKFYLEDDSIQSTWDYYYNYIFWPAIGNKIIERPPLILNVKKFWFGVNQLIKMFDKNIKLIS